MAVGFELLKRLGAGHFGEVWLAIDKGLDAERAVKFIPSDRVLDPGNFFHEAQILQSVQHSNIVRVEETGNMDDGRIYVAMEYLPKGSLEDEARGAYVDLTRAKKVMVDVLRGLGHAHDKGILHRDIKPANILIGHNGEGKLSDFGLAVPASVNLSASNFKDYAYLIHRAPELQKKPIYSAASDIYAAGVTLYRLVNGDSYLPPVGTADLEALIANGEFPDRQRYREFIPRPVRVIVNKAMNVDPKKRYRTAAAMRHALEQIEVNKNWKESLLPAGIKWTCGWGDFVYEVRRERLPTGRWQVEVRKGRTKKKLRRMLALCLYDASKQQAERQSRQVLQKMVLGQLA